MRLVELEPRWFVLHDGGQRVGFTFQCPHCKNVRLGVAVHDEGKRIIQEQESDAHGPGTVWKMLGTDFHDLSLIPSVDASAFGHWHGMLTNGEVQ